MYFDTLTDLYGSVEKAPAQNIDCLNHLAEIEGPERDRFIQRDFVSRTMHSLQAEGEKILMEAEDILNPNLALYPNPTRMCSRYCSFLEPCLALDNGDDWEWMIENGYQKRQTEELSWRSKMQYPSRQVVRKVLMAAQ